MAKEKVEKSLDELLEEAIVKEDGQPYEVPGNWVWSNLGSILSFEYGKAMPKRRRSGDGYPVYGSNGIVGFHKEALVDGPAIIIGRKGSIGEINWSNDKCWPIDTTYYVKIYNNLDFEFLYKLLTTINFKKLNRATAIPGLNREDAYKSKIVVPPLPEQKRIVKKLSSMLGKLKEARELIQKARDTFEERRAAILNKAFTGELTKKWRDENPDVASAEKLIEILITEKKKQRKEGKKEKIPTYEEMIIEESEQPYEVPGNWAWVKLGNLLIEVEKKDPKKEGSKEFTYLDISSIDNKVGRITDPKIYKGVEAPSRARQIIKTNDILFATVRTYLKNIAMVEETYNNQIASTGFCVMRCCKSINSRLLFRFVGSDIFIDRLNGFQRGISYPAVKTSDLLDQPIPLPPFSEQKEIIRILEKVLNHEDEANALIAMEEHIDLMKKSILSKAFSGELGTNDTNDEPAIELLKRSLKEKMNK